MAIPQPKLKKINKQMEQIQRHGDGPWASGNETE